jgi:YesN/AraC family two-component response regulator
MQTDNGHVDLNTVEDIDDKTSMPGNIKSLDTEDLLRSEKKVRLLIVEDNDELRYYLFNALSRDYEVTEARNGKEGLELAESRQPEFIITDLMMPEMDGITMIRKIKSSPDVRHIPIIVLSAKTAITYKIEGMKEGIDDYITKPFSVEYLKTRMRNIIEKRRELQQAYVDKLSSPTGNAYKLDVPKVDDADDLLIKNVMAYLNTNASNSDLRITDIAKSVGLSQTVFYGKMKSIVGMSPGDFLRHVRMEKAKEMIAHSDLTFSEIAYAVGFSDPKYFSRCFKTDVGMTAKDYRIKFKK